MQTEITKGSIVRLLYEGSMGVVVDDSYYGGCRIYWFHNTSGVDAYLGEMVYSREELMFVC